MIGHPTTIGGFPLPSDAPLFTAFYVDNGPNLPLWRELPPLAFWILLTLIGAPILINALLHHPLVRNHPMVKEIRGREPRN